MRSSLRNIIWKRIFKTGRRRAWIHPLIAALLMSAIPPVAAQMKKVNPKELAQQYQEWLKVTAYITTDKELDAFLRLTDDRDRDLFTDSFWKIRDPTPGTPANEYKEEIYKRFHDANKKFSRRSAREGWMTDQGRYYIMLGPPLSTEDIAGSNDIYPAEIWSYNGDTGKGMPAHFSLVFYQWHNSGEYKLYDPFIDGPFRLLIDARDMDPNDYEAAYEKIFDQQPDLAVVCLSVIPGQIPMGYQPSPDNEMVMASINESPKKNINVSYATHFLNYKGVVSTEYLTNYKESDMSTAIIYDSVTGAAFCEFAISPKDLPVDLYEPKNEYFTDFQADVSVRTGNRIIFQYSKDFPLTIPAANLSQTENMGVCIQDSFPLIEGKYKLTVLLRNTVGKEFSVLEREVEVPASPGRPRISGPVLGYRFSDGQPGAHVPYQSLGKKISVDPKSTYCASDQIAFIFDIVNVTEELWRNGTAEVLIKGAKPIRSFQKSLTIHLNGQPFHGVMSFAQAVAASELLPDYYDMTIVLKDQKGAVLDEGRANFAVSAEKTLAHPMVAAKATPLANAFMFDYMRAYQYDQMNQNEKAEAAYRRAFALNPAYKLKIPEFSQFLLKIKKFEDALTLIESIKTEEKLKYQYYFVKGLVLQAMGKFSEALENLSMGNKIYNSDTRLLNALGECYSKLKRTDEAVATLKASLKLDPNQEDVKKLLASIEIKKN